jgi:hypothetical protein
MYLQLLCSCGECGGLSGILQAWISRCEYLRVFFGAFESMFAGYFALVAVWLQIIVASASGFCDSFSSESNKGK